MWEEINDALDGVDLTQDEILAMISLAHCDDTTIEIFLSIFKKLRALKKI